jgi:hypothetical protein
LRIALAKESGFVAKPVWLGWFFNDDLPGITENFTNRFAYGARGEKGYNGVHSPGLIGGAYSATAASE